MLGIRKYRGIAIDLWLGPWQTFVSDAEVFAGPGHKDLLKNAPLKGVRHLAIIIGPGDTTSLTAAAADYLLPLRGALDQLENSAPLQRITFILGDRDCYQRYQTALFAHFPE